MFKEKPGIICAADSGCRLSGIKIEGGAPGGGGSGGNEAHRSSSDSERRREMETPLSNSERERERGERGKKERSASIEREKVLRVKTLSIDESSRSMFVLI